MQARSAQSGLSVQKIPQFSCIPGTHKFSQGIRAFGLRFPNDIMLTVHNCLTAHFSPNNCDKCTGYASFGGGTEDEVVLGSG